MLATLALLLSACESTLPTGHPPTFGDPQPHQRTHGIYQHSTAFTVGSQQTSKATVACPTDEFLVSGGYHLQPGMLALDSYPSDASGVVPAVSGQTTEADAWTVVVQNAATAPQAGRVDVACAYLPSRSLTVRIARTPARLLVAGGTGPRTGTGQVHAACPAGTVLVGAGYTSSWEALGTSGATISVRASYPDYQLIETAGQQVVNRDPSASWRFVETATLAGGTAQEQETASTITASLYTICLPGTVLTGVYAPPATLTVQPPWLPCANVDVLRLCSPHWVGTQQVSCLRGQMLTGLGYSGLNSGASRHVHIDLSPLITQNGPVADPESNLITGWHVRVDGFVQVPSDLQSGVPSPVTGLVYPVCVALR